MWQPPGSLLEQMQQAEIDAWEAERRAIRPDRAGKRAFRSSLAWRRVRYAVLAESAAQNGGKPACALCGATASPGRSLHVDHVFPIATDKGWEHRFDRRFLRVSCADCNVGRLASPIEMEGWTPDEG